MYNLISNTWIEIKPEIQPPARKNACMSFIYPYLLIYGGENSNGYLNDFWKFDLEYNYFAELQNDLVPALTEHVCGFDPTYGFYVFGGRTDGYVLNNLLYLFAGVWLGPFPLPSSLYISKTGLILLDDIFVVIGGNQIDVSLSNITLFVTDTGVGYNLDNLPVSVTAHAVTQAGRNIYVFGGTLSMGSRYQTEVGTSNMYVVNSEYFKCSLGFYGASCLPCVPGSYSEGLGSDTCKLCPAGTYSDRYGLGFLSQCTPCASGTFSDRPGATYCKYCSNPNDCPVGSTGPRVVDTIETFSETQPLPYNDKNGIAAEYISEFQIAVYAVIVATALLYVILLKSGGFKYIDFFKNQHEFEQGQDPEGTSFGGAVTVMFFVASSFFIVSPSILYFIANITETKTLIPSLTLDNQIFNADLFLINITLYNYGGECGDIYGNCLGHVDIYSKGFPKGNPSCWEVADTCIVTLQCHNCSIDTSAYVKVTFWDFLVYATGIKIEVMSSSSIPDSNTSSIQFYLSPGQGKVFNGLSSSVITVSMYPSVHFM